MLEHVEARAGDFAGFDHPRQRVLVDDFAARGIHDESLGPQHLQPARRQQVIGRRRVRTIDRHDIHAGEHLVEALPIGRVEVFLDLRRDPAAIVIMDLQAEGAGAARHGLSDAAHADDAETFAPDAMAEHPCRRPAVPVLIRGQNIGAFDEPPWHRQDQSHRHVGGVFGEHARRVRHGDAALNRGDDVDVVDAVAKVGDQLELLAGLAEHGGIDPVGNGRHQHVGDLDRFGKIVRGHRFVVGIEPGVKKFPHPQLDAVGQFAGDDHYRFLVLRHIQDAPFRPL